jgi:hypothetical protein
MINRAGFERDIAIIAEWATDDHRERDEINKKVFAIAHDYDATFEECWYEFAHTIIEREL